MSNYAPLALEGGRGMGKRLVRLVVVVVVMGGLSAYPAVMSSARADDTIALQLELTRVCQGTSGPPYGGNPVCIDSGAALDGSFVGTTPTQSAPPGVDCTGTWQLVAVDGSGDGRGGSLCAGYTAASDPRRRRVSAGTLRPGSTERSEYHRRDGICERTCGRIPLSLR